MNSSVIQDNDAPYLIGEVAKSSPVGRQLAWAFVKERWQQMFGRYGSNIFLLGRMLSAILNDFSTEEQLRDVESFFDDGRPVGTGRNAIDQAVINIKFRIAYTSVITRDQWFE